MDIFLYTHTYWATPNQLIDHLVAYMERLSNLPNVSEIASILVDLLLLWSKEYLDASAVDNDFKNKWKLLTTKATNLSTLKVEESKKLKSFKFSDVSFPKVFKNVLKINSLLFI